MTDASVWDQLDSTDAPYHESSMRINHDTEKVIERAVARGRDLERRVAEALATTQTQPSYTSTDYVWGFSSAMKRIRAILQEPTP